MKSLTLVTSLLFLSGAPILVAQETSSLSEAEKAAALQKHQEVTEELADDQDELSADVQELIDEQTHPKVIELLSEVETLMAEAIDRLEEQDTGGDTIVIPTEIIEKIFQAAKQKSQSEGQGQKPQADAMLEMMKQMMGKGEKAPEGEKKESDQEGENAGKAGGGDSDAPTEDVNGASDETTSERRIPRAAGASGTGLPPEFQKTLEAYNRSASQEQSTRNTIE